MERRLDDLRKNVASCRSTAAKVATAARLADVVHDAWRARTAGDEDEVFCTVVEFVFNRIESLVFDDIWGNRVAGANAAGLVCAVLARGIPSAQRVELIAPVRGAPLPLTFDTFDMTRVIERGEPLVACGLERVYKAARTAALSAASMDPTLRARLQRSEILRVLGYESAAAHDHAETARDARTAVVLDDQLARVITDNDLQDAEVKVAGSISYEPLSTLVTASLTTCRSAAGATDGGTATPARNAACALSRFVAGILHTLFDVRWEKRHGAACALSRVIKNIAITASLPPFSDLDSGECGATSTGIASPGESRLTATRVHESSRAVANGYGADVAQDIVLRCIAVLALDRFGDYAGDGVVAPVRDAAGEALAAALPLLTAAGRVFALQRLLAIAEHSDWNVRHGCFIGFRTLAVVRQDAVTAQSQAVATALPDVARSFGDNDTWTRVVDLCILTINNERERDDIVIEAAAVLRSLVAAAALLREEVGCGNDDEPISLHKKDATTILSGAIKRLVCIHEDTSLVAGPLMALAAALVRMVVAAAPQSETARAHAFSNEASASGTGQPLSRTPWVIPRLVVCAIAMVRHSALAVRREAVETLGTVVDLLHRSWSDDLLVVPDVGEPQSAQAIRRTIVASIAEECTWWAVVGVPSIVRALWRCAVLEPQLLIANEDDVALGAEDDAQFTTASGMRGDGQRESRVVKLPGFHGRFGAGDVAAPSAEQDALLNAISDTSLSSFLARTLLRCDVKGWPTSPGHVNDTATSVPATSTHCSVKSINEVQLPFAALTFVRHCAGVIDHALQLLRSTASPIERWRWLRDAVDLLCVPDGDILCGPAAMPLLLPALPSLELLDNQTCYGNAEEQVTDTNCVHDARVVQCVRIESADCLAAHVATDEAGLRMDPPLGTSQCENKSRKGAAIPTLRRRVPHDWSATAVTAESEYGVARDDVLDVDAVRLADDEFVDQQSSEECTIDAANTCAWSNEVSLSWRCDTEAAPVAAGAARRAIGASLLGLILSHIGRLRNAFTSDVKLVNTATRDAAKTEPSDECVKVFAALLDPSGQGMDTYTAGALARKGNITSATAAQARSLTAAAWTTASCRPVAIAEVLASGMHTALDAWSATTIATTTVNGRSPNVSTIEPRGDIALRVGRAGASTTAVATKSGMLPSIRVLPSAHALSRLAACPFPAEATPSFSLVAVAASDLYEALSAVAAHEADSVLERCDGPEKRKRLSVLDALTHSDTANSVALLGDLAKWRALASNFVSQAEQTSPAEARPSSGRTEPATRSTRRRGSSAFTRDAKQITAEVTLRSSSGVLLTPSWASLALVHWLAGPCSEHVLAGTATMPAAACSGEDSENNGCGAYGLSVVSNRERKRGFVSASRDAAFHGTDTRQRNETLRALREEVWTQALRCRAQLTVAECRAERFRSQAASAIAALAVSLIRSHASVPAHVSPIVRALLRSVAGRTDETDIRDNLDAAVCQSIVGAALARLASLCAGPMEAESDHAGQCKIGGHCDRQFDVNGARRHSSRLPSKCDETTVVAPMRRRDFSGAQARLLEAMLWHAGVDSTAARQGALLWVIELCIAATAAQPEHDRLDKWPPPLLAPLVSVGLSRHVQQSSEAVDALEQQLLVIVPMVASLLALSQKWALPHITLTLLDGILSSVISATAVVDDSVLNASDSLLRGAALAMTVLLLRRPSLWAAAIARCVLAPQQAELSNSTSRGQQYPALVLGRLRVLRAILDAATSPRVGRRLVELCGPTDIIEAPVATISAELYVSHVSPMVLPMLLPLLASHDSRIRDTAAAAFRCAVSILPAPQSTMPQLLYGNVNGVAVAPQYRSVDCDAVRATLHPSICSAIDAGEAIAATLAAGAATNRNILQLSQQLYQPLQTSVGNGITSGRATVTVGGTTDASSTLPALAAPASVNLRHYQLDGISWLTFLRRHGLHGVLADEMGLGKTVMTLAAIAWAALDDARPSPRCEDKAPLLRSVTAICADNAFAAPELSHVRTRTSLPRVSLIIGPATLLRHWESEVKKCYGDVRQVPRGRNSGVTPTAGDERRRILDTVHLAGSPSARATLLASVATRQCNSDFEAGAPLHTLLLVSYAVARQDVEALGRAGPWAFCVLDEGHLVANPASRTSLALRSGSIGGAALHRLILSGTPIANAPTDVWALFDFLMPGYLGSQSSFRQRTAAITRSRSLEATAVDISSAKVSLSALHASLLPFVLRRLKGNVLKELPAKSMRDVACVMEGEQRALYEALAAVVRGDGAVAHQANVAALQTNQLLSQRATETHDVAACDSLVIDAIDEDDEMSVPVTMPLGAQAIDELGRCTSSGISGTVVMSHPHIKRVAAAESSPQPRVPLPLILKRVAGNALLTLTYLRSIVNHPALLPIDVRKALLAISASLWKQPIREPAAVATDGAAYDCESSAKMRALRDLLLGECGYVPEPCTQRHMCATFSSPSTYSSNDSIDSSDAVTDDDMDFADAGTGAPQTPIGAPSSEPINGGGNSLPGSSRRKVLIFAQGTRLLDVVEAAVLHPALGWVRGHQYLRLDGRTAVSTRVDVASRFNTDPDVSVLLLTTGAGGIGLSLVGADTVIFVDHSWNPVTDAQAADRAHRLGQRSHVVVIRLLAANSVEERVLGLQAWKVGVAEAVVGASNADLRGAMADAPLLQLLGRSA